MWDVVQPLMNDDRNGTISAIIGGYDAHVLHHISDARLMGRLPFFTRMHSPRLTCSEPRGIYHVRRMSACSFQDLDVLM